MVLEPYFKCTIETYNENDKRRNPTHASSEIHDLQKLCPKRIGKQTHIE